MLTPQLILFILGIVAFVMAFVFAAIAARTFFRLDIRSVMDDLAGKQHQGGTRAIRPASRQTPMRSRRVSDMLDEEPVRQQGDLVFDDEDGVATEAGGLRESSRKISVDEFEASQKTAVWSHAQPKKGGAWENDASFTMVADEDMEDLSETLAGTSHSIRHVTGESVAFEVVKKEINCSADEIIAAG